MTSDDPIVYPYIPNSVAAVKRHMLDQVNASSAEDFYKDIPPSLRLTGPLNLPPPFLDECALKRHVESILSRNRPVGKLLSFLGAGCYQHHVPAICDEINQRAEFLTAYAGEPYDDHGRFQALFEHASMMGELLNMDVVNVPTYDGFQAVATSLRMAARITERKQVLLCSTLDPAKLSKIGDYARHEMDIRLLPYEPATGQLDLEALRAALSDQTAAVYFENPSYLGFLESQGAEVAQIAHSYGALCVVGVDPSTLGTLAPPADYGADIVCGDIQPLGMHMQFGGGQAGFIATRDEEQFVREYPSRLFGIAPTMVPGEYGFGDVAYERTSFAQREQGKEWVGTAAALWGITAGVYLALMGPQGMAELGQSIMTKCCYAMRVLDRIPGITVPIFQGPHFQEFVVRFDGTPKTVAQVNRDLLTHGIQGGKDLSDEFPELGNTALYCVSEVHTQGDLDRLAYTLAEVMAE